MRIAIDITSLKSGHRDRGVGKYTRLLLDSLRAFESEQVYIEFSRSEGIPSNVDIIHYPYFDPFFLTLPLIKLKPTVVTVHDLIPLQYPAYFPRGLRGEFKWQIQRWSLGRSHGVIADSHASKKAIIAYTDVSLENIHVVYLAPSAQFVAVQSNIKLSSLQKKYNLPPKFILYVGDLNWSKNIEGLIHAFAKLLCEEKIKNTDIELCLVGKAFLDTQLPEAQKIITLIDTLSLTQKVRCLGYVPDEDLPGLYTLATCYIQPSYAEGFGLPVLEAMACGCPTVVAKGSSLSEIAGPSILVDPHNVDSVIHGLQEGLSLQVDRPWKDGRAWATRFSWEKVAHETMNVYKTVLKQY